MASVDDYVARIEGVCGAERDVVVIFKFEKKDEVIQKIMQRTQHKNTIAGVIYELTFKEYSFRLYTSGKAIFRSIKNKQILKKLLADLLL
ncbi:MAG: hypothetical protein NWF01_05865 [Candidatus Bathyarchaeota archaeon]|nr:hypothetical protein [Candidatus Bathyarchaeota archaeon]